MRGKIATRRLGPRAGASWTPTRVSTAALRRAKAMHGPSPSRPKLFAAFVLLTRMSRRFLPWCMLSIAVACAPTGGSVPSDKAFMSGTVTAVGRVAQGWTVRVEERPQEASGSAKGVFRVGERTDVRRTGGAARADELRLGQRVRVAADRDRRRRALRHSLGSTSESVGSTGPRPPSAVELGRLGQAARVTLGPRTPGTWRSVS